MGEVALDAVRRRSDHILSEKELVERVPNVDNMEGVQVQDATHQVDGLIVVTGMEGCLTAVESTNSMQVVMFTDPASLCRFNLNLHQPSTQSRLTIARFSRPLPLQSPVSPLLAVG
ncbi:hypothetical protein V6N12_048918 [Hibiscus sabdariffa]|uniref:Uncharacterized protein n=1 Tax=Hibiscus sabdariffa TaxID=183260 RepID=A0ABR2EIN3_9ROSI